MILFSNKEKSDLYGLLVKYDGIYPDFGNALSNVIQGKQNEKDLLTIHDYMDYETSLEYEDFMKIDSYLGLEIEIIIAQ